MREANPDSVRTGLDGSRILFLVAIAVICGYFGLVASTNVTTPFVIVSGSSMEPTYHAGDLLLVESVVPASIVEGDVVVFYTPRNGISAGLPSRIAHRVIGIQPTDGMLGYLTRGDNSDKDSFVVPSNLLIGSVRMNLGQIGKIVSFLTNVKLLLMIGIPIAVAGGVFWLLTRDIDEESESKSESVSEKPSTPITQPASASTVTIGEGKTASFVAAYDDRRADRTITNVNKLLLTRQLEPELRQAFENVTDRLAQLKAQRTSRGVDE
jgi:signal peptidase I